MVLGLMAGWIVQFVEDVSDSPVTDGFSIREDGCAVWFKEAFFGRPERPTVRSLLVGRRWRSKRARREFGATSARWKGSSSRCTRAFAPHMLGKMLREGL